MARRDTLGRILDGALALFIERGVDGTPVVEIERAAGLSPGSGSFYRHFPNKAAVLTAVVEREVQRAAVARELRRQRSGSLAEEFRQTLDDLDGQAALITLLGREGARHPALFRPVLDVLAQGGLPFDAAAIQQHVPRLPHGIDDYEAVAEVAMYAMVGAHLAEQFFDDAIALDRDRFASTLARLIASTSG